MDRREEKFRISLCRTAKGILLNTKVSPAIEEYMAGLSTGKMPYVDFMGGASKAKWFPHKESNPLYIYAIDANTLSGLTGTRYRTDLHNYGLTYTNDYGATVANLSFLRLVGTSSPEGVSVIIKSPPTSAEELVNLRDRLLHAGKQFILDFVQPTSVDGVIYEMEVNEA